jgi:hypothetical protein
VSDTESVASPTPIWYGVQTLIPAAAAGGLAVGGLVLCHSPTCDEVTLAVAATAFALGGGVVHLFHHNSRAALIGLVAKIGLPALGYGVGSLIDSCDPHQSYLCSADGQSSLAVGAFIGVLAGALLAGAIDVGMSQEPALAPPPGRIRVTGPRVAPTVLVTRDRASLALVGRF